MGEKDDLLERKTVLKNKILTLEWDKKKHQIHIAKEHKLKKYKEELQGIEEKLGASK